MNVCYRKLGRNPNSVNIAASGSVDRGSKALSALLSGIIVIRPPP